MKHIQQLLPARGFAVHRQRRRMPSFQKVNIGAQRFDQITRTVGFEAKQHHDRSGPTFSYDIFVFRFYEAAVRDLRQSAISRPWQLHLNFSCRVETNGWFSAIKLIARISGPGHNPTVEVAIQFQ